MLEETVGWFQARYAEEATRNCIGPHIVMVRGATCSCLLSTVHLHKGDKV